MTGSSHNAPYRDASGSDRGRLLNFPGRNTDASSPENNLPFELTSLVGREKEISEVGRLLLGETRLVTLTGPGGCGKTRLALAVAKDLLGSFEDGAWLVELAPLSKPDLVQGALASVLGVREQPGRPLLGTLSDYLEDKKMLLVLDNCEHLVEACVDLAGALLRSCQDLWILATSREALGITGEVGWPVPPLSLPDPRHLPAVEGLPRSVTTDSNGKASFSLAAPKATAAGRFVTATATSASGDTSEFSEAKAVSLLPKKKHHKKHHHH